MRIRKCLHRGCNEWVMVEDCFKYYGDMARGYALQWDDIGRPHYHHRIEYKDLGNYGYEKDAFRKSMKQFSVKCK